MIKNFKILLSTALLCGLMLLTGMTVVSAQETTKQKVEKLDNLPRYAYKIPGNVTELVKSDEAFAAFAAELRTNLEKTLV
ncbi:MAG: hypothetical protein ACOYVF_07430 [Candidatus Zixiibacteriota bacterium]